MGDKDRREKILASYNDVFADIVNGCLFDGEQVVRAEEFTDATPWSYYSDVSGEVHDQERDVAKYWSKAGVYISMIGIENQTDPDPNMPIRVMSYDAAAYRSQLSQDDMHSLYPVLSLVLYCGHERPWSAPPTLKECLTIPPELRPHVFDYGMNLYQLAWMSHEEVDRRFHGDFWIFADYLVQVRENKAYHPTRRTLRHKREILMLLNTMERDDRYETAYNDLMQDPVKSKEDWNMCDVLDQVENRGIERGIEQERKRMASVLDQVENRGVARGIEQERKRMAGVLDQVENRGVAKGIEQGIAQERLRMAGVLDQVENRGVARGIEQGVHQERKRIVLSLAANGAAAHDIATTMQLSPETVAEMLQDAN